MEMLRATADRRKHRGERKEGKSTPEARTEAEERVREIRPDVHVSTLEDRKESDEASSFSPEPSAPSVTATPYTPDHRRYAEYPNVPPGGPPIPSAPEVEELIRQNSFEERTLSRSNSFEQIDHPSLSPEDLGRADEIRGHLKQPQNGGVARSTDSYWWPFTSAYTAIFGSSESKVQNHSELENGAQSGTKAARERKTADCKDLGDKDCSNHAECPICMEEITEAKAVGRCRGDHGQEHMFHAHCLGEWIEKSTQDSKMSLHGARCPICRGAVLVHVDRLRSRLQADEKSPPSQRLISPHSRDFFQRMLGKFGARENGWTNLITEDNVKAVALTAGTIVAATTGFNAGWEFDILSLIRAQRWLLMTQGIQASMEGKTMSEANTETISGGFRLIHLGAGFAGMSARIANYILRLHRESEDDRQRKRG